MNGCGPLFSPQHPVLRQWATTRVSQILVFDLPLATSIGRGPGLWTRIVDLMILTMSDTTQTRFMTIDSPCRNHRPANGYASSVQRPYAVLYRTGSASCGYSTRYTNTRYYSSRHKSSIGTWKSTHATLAGNQSNAERMKHSAWLDKIFCGMI